MHMPFYTLCVETKDEERVVSVRSAACFKPVLQVAAAGEGAGIVPAHENRTEPMTANQPPPDGPEADGMCVVVEAK